MNVLPIMITGLIIGAASSIPSAALALSVEYRDRTYELEVTKPIVWNNELDILKLQPWWGDPDFAKVVAEALWNDNKRLELSSSHNNYQTTWENKEFSSYAAYDVNFQSDSSGYLYAARHHYIAGVQLTREYTVPPKGLSYGILADPKPQPVPEPLTIVGSAIALGFGVGLKVLKT